MLPPQYKKGLGRPKKLRFREHDESGSRIRRPVVAYKCTKCDKFGHNLKKCQSKEKDPNRNTPRTKASSIVVEIEWASKTNALEMCNPTHDVTQIEQTQVEKADQAVDKVVENKKKVAKAIENKKQVAKVVEKKKQMAKAVEKKKQVAKAVENKKKVDKKNTHAPKRSSDMLKYVWRYKNNIGPGSISVAPLVVDEEHSVKKMRSWEDISRTMIQ
ncbi:hypothetical protein KIW84_020131 [Lathyrus oleraceus]|uniref:CCHC-type domain-containing protein n=1 Tax=Pisum sativum TaxID=3888 RepID=A0A9D5B7G2_PEA|nr:hypothetical protein KIW84_020131 [Pisum sativum]